MSSDDRAVVQRFLDGIHARDEAVVGQCLSPDIVIDEADGLPYSGQYVGVEGLGALNARIGECGLEESFTSYEVIDAGDRVIALLTIELTNAAGETAESRVVEVYTVEHGLITHVDVFYKNPLAVAELVVSPATA